jgi:hypothetical protein
MIPTNCFFLSFVDETVEEMPEADSLQCISSVIAMSVSWAAG